MTYFQIAIGTPKQETRKMIRQKTYLKLLIFKIILSIPEVLINEITISCTGGGTLPVAPDSFADSCLAPLYQEDDSRDQI